MPEHDDNDDGRLFREAIGADRGEVRQLPASALPPSLPQPAPAAKMAAHDARLAGEEFRQWATSAIPEATGRGWRRDGIPPLTMERLARGEFAVQAEFRAAPRSHEPLQRQIAGFLHASRRQALGCVRIILPPVSGDDAATSAEHPIEHALEHRAEVLAFHAATTPRGGLVLTLLLAPPRR